MLKVVKLTVEMNFRTLKTVHQAIRDRDLPELKRLIEIHHADVNRLEKHPHRRHGWEPGMPMHVAADYGNVDAAEILLANGGEINGTGGLSNTPLHWAATTGHGNIVTWLINHGAKVDSINIYGDTPIYYTVVYDQAATAEVLLTAGASANHPGGGGRTPLHHAVMFGSDVIVQLLLDHGADPQIKDENGQSALDLVRVEGQGSQQIKCLLQTYVNNNEAHRHVLLSDDLQSRKNSRVSSSAGTGVTVASDVTSMLSDVSVESIDQPYAMKKTSYRGVAVIINNQDFSGSGMSNRDGSQQDRDRLHAQLATFGLDVHCHENLSAAEMGQCLTHYSRLDHGSYNCFICCILSHGKEGEIYGIYGRSLTPLQITSGFLADKSPSLNEKPKVFVIVACKGPHEKNVNNTDADAVGDKPVHEKDLIPLQEEDFLVAFSTIPDHVSYRHPSDGTKYVKHLAMNMSKYGDQKCFTDVLRNTEKHLIEDTHTVEDGRRMKQVCLYASTLRRPFILKRAGHAQKYMKLDNTT